MRVSVPTDKRIKTKQAELPGKFEFPWYLASSGAWLGAMSLQGFLITWLLIGTLNTPADKTGFLRGLIELPSIMVLVGGILADRFDPRRMLQFAHFIIALPPLLLAIAYHYVGLNLWLVVAFGMTMVALQGISDPARQTMLNHITRIDIQRTVTLTTIVTTLVGIFAMWVGGKLENIGLVAILFIQSAFFLLGLLAINRLKPLPNRIINTRLRLIQGFRIALQHSLVRNLIGLNFASALFNAGAYLVAIPFIVKHVYAGDAAFYANVIILFTCGGLVANGVLYRFMPLLKPGRLFLILQLSRASILTLLLLKPGLSIFYLCIFFWGLNMGGTSTLVRSILQESAPEQQRAQILSLLTFSFMISTLISSPALGLVVNAYSPLEALIPGIIMSIFIFAVGLRYSGLWSHESPAALTSPKNLKNN
ncbi:MAG: MFS transporter [Pseudomonadales bacterium]|nr:MFS transporter [Pseudomonadales bacterium]